MKKLKVGPVIREAREAAGLTQQALADRAKVTRMYVYVLERDRKSPTLDVLVRVAAALGVRASTLVARAEGRGPT